jgi:hypothetical protein
MTTKVFTPEEILEVWSKYDSSHPDRLDVTKPLTTTEVAVMVRTFYGYTPYSGGNQCVLPALRKLVETGLAVTTVRERRRVASRHVPMSTDDEYRWLTKGTRATYSDRVWATRDVAAAHKATLDRWENQESTMAGFADRLAALMPGTLVDPYRTTLNLRLDQDAAEWLVHELEWARARREADR